MTRLDELRQLRLRVDMEIAAESLLRGISPAEVTDDGRVLVSMDQVDPTAIRDWARGQGYELAVRGPLSHQVREAYQFAHRPGAGSVTRPPGPAPSLLTEVSA